jgi:hypothetical protein
MRDPLEGLTPSALAELGRAFAERARRGGAYVVRPDGSEVAIPAILTPVVLPRARMAAASADARRLLAGLATLTVWLMETDDAAPLRQRLFGAFTPLEAEGLRRTYRAAEQLATARVDFLVDADGELKALEMNATIPAMQGYSDAVAEAWLTELAAKKNLDPAPLIEANGRNADDLLASLVAHHLSAGGPRAEGLHIAIVARPGDAQRGELDHYARRWSALGHSAVVVTPADVCVDGGVAKAAGQVPDLFYRHIFARRLDGESDFARMLLEPRRFRVFNPIASHLEVKGMLALLSQAASDPLLAGQAHLDDDVIGAVRRVVPWTRVVAPGATIGPDGERIEDLPAFIRAEGERLVLKRSWDYGGKSVFLGAELDVERAREVTGADTWSAIVDHALRAEDAWVVQALVRAPTRRMLRVDDSGLETHDLYVDLSAYTNLGDAPPPRGGAVRAARSRIVNILGGGGMAPLITEDVAAQLL